MVATSTSPSVTEWYSLAIAFCPASATRTTTRRSAVLNAPDSRRKTRIAANTNRYIAEPRRTSSRRPTVGTRTLRQSTAVIACMRDPSEDIAWRRPLSLEPNQPTRPTDPRDPPDHGERSEASAKVGFRRDVPEGG